MKHLRLVWIMFFFLLIQTNNLVFAVNQGSITAWPTPSVDNLSLLVTIKPDKTVQGQPGALFVAAQLADQTWYYATNAGSWQVWDTKSPLPAFLSTTTLEASYSFLAMQGANLSTYAGATVYAGYGLDLQSMITDSTYNPVYFVPNVNSVPEPGGMVVTIGLPEDNSAVISMIHNALEAGLTKRGVPFEATSSSVNCSKESDSVACYDYRFFIPHLTESNAHLLKSYLSDGPIADILNNPTTREKVTFIRSRGVQKGDYTGTLFAFRKAVESSIVKASDNATTRQADQESIRAQRSAPAPTAMWQGNQVQTIEAATVTALNTTFAYLVAEPWTFVLVSGCTPLSTISTLEFCNSLEASSSYNGGSTIDSGCTGICQGYYETCKAAEKTCKAACFWGGCGCGMNCSGQQTSCDNGCVSTFTGSVEIKVKSVTGLEKTLFTSASIPSLTDTTTITETVDVLLNPGVTAQVYWKLCQSGICASGTDPLSSSQVALTASTTVTAEACTNGGNALYLNITALTITEYGLWGIPAFVDEVLGHIDSSLDWLADNISDLFSADLQAPYEALLTDTTTDLMNGLNTLLKKTPIIACSSS